MIITQNGNKKYVVVLVCFLVLIWAFIFVISMLLPFIFAQDDWSYQNLPGKYEVWKINVEDIRLVRDDNGVNITVVDRYIVAFCYDERYIGIKKVVINEGDSDDIFDADSISDSMITYVLVDTNTNSISGPLSKHEYEQKLQDLSIEMNEWISTDTVKRNTGDG